MTAESAQERKIPVKSTRDRPETSAALAGNQAESGKDSTGLTKNFAAWTEDVKFCHHRKSEDWTYSAALTDISADWTQDWADLAEFPAALTEFREDWAKYFGALTEFPADLAEYSDTGTEYSGALSEFLAASTKNSGDLAEIPANLPKFRGRLGQARLNSTGKPPDLTEARWALDPNGSDWSETATLPNSRSFKFTSLALGKDVWVRVRARNTIGAGPWSDPATIMVT